MPTLEALKRAARVTALHRRAACDPACGSALADHVIETCPPPRDAIVAGVWPLAGEIDLRPLMLRLAARGQKLALPVTPRRGLPLSFRAWAPGDPLESGRFGTRHPVGPELDPDVIFVPLLAFDRRGFRLGYGGGYYDRTLAARPDAIPLGFGYSALEVDRVPAGPQDARLPQIATEAWVIQCDTKEV